MSYLHCHSCDFSQDDFWSEGYNPITSIQDFEENLFKEDFYEESGLDNNWKEEIGYGRDFVLTNQELLAHEFERRATRIRKMVYRTFEEFKKKNPKKFAIFIIIVHRHTIIWIDPNRLC